MSKQVKPKIEIIEPGGGMQAWLDHMARMQASEAEAPPGGMQAWLDRMATELEQKQARDAIEAADRAFAEDR